MPKKIIKAFTLLELLVVIAIIGIFATFAYPNISKWIADREVRKEVYAYYLEYLTKRDRIFLTRARRSLMEV